MKVSERKDLEPLVKPQIHFIPEQLQEQEFRGIVNKVMGELTLKYLQSEHDFVPSLSSLFRLLAILLTTRLSNGAKYHRAKTTIKMTKQLDKENDKTHKYPRYIYAIKEWIVMMRFQDKSSFGFAYVQDTKVLVDAIMQLFLAHFEGLNKKTGNITKCFIHNPLAFDDHFFPILNKLKEKDTNENELEGVLSILKSDYFLKRICKRWDYINQFLDAISSASMHENIHKNIQEHIFNLFNAFIKKFHVQPLSLKLPEQNNEELGFSQELFESVKEKRSFIAQKKL
jgi:hypothetical protein